MAEALTKQATKKRVAQWKKEVLELQAQALELVVEDRKASNEKPLTDVAMELVQLTEDAFHLLWSGWTAELVFASATASLKAGRPVLAMAPVKAIPGMPVGLIDEEVEPPQKLQRDASEVRVIREADPVVELAPEPQCVEALVEEVEEIEVEVPEPTPEPEPEPEPEPPLPVVVSDAEWEDTPAPEPAEPEPEPQPEPEPAAAPPAAPEPDAWVVCSRLAELLNCSPSAVSADRRDGVFDGCWREPLPGEGKGVRYNVEACRVARDNKQDRRKSRPRRPNLRSITPEKLAADPALLAAVEELLAAVRGES